MPIRFLDRPRRHQFELRYLYGLKTRRERLRELLRRIEPAVEIALGCVCGSGWGIVFLVVLATGNRGRAYEPSPKPLANPAEDESLRLKSDSGRAEAFRAQWGSGYA
jgi:hypothetical protein